MTHLLPSQLLRNIIGRVEIPYSWAKLDPTIKAIAKHYKFDIKYCNILNKWIIKHTDKTTELYWSSTEDFDDFMVELQEFFIMVGMESRERS